MYIRRETRFGVVGGGRWKVGGVVDVHVHLRRDEVVRGVWKGFGKRPMTQQTWD